MSFHLPIHEPPNEVAVCSFCSQPLFSEQPMSVPDCADRNAHGCGPECRPVGPCPPLTGDVQHVGCARWVSRH
jgi:hypothetical protein